MNSFLLMDLFPFQIISNSLLFLTNKQTDHLKNIDLYAKGGVKNRIYLTFKNFDHITLVGIGHKKEGADGLINLLSEIHSIHHFIQGFEDKERNSIFESKKESPAILQKINFIDKNYIYPQLNSLKIKLTQSEINCLELIQKNFTSLEIAQSLFVSKRTIDKHIQNIMIKTGCISRKQIIEFLLPHNRQTSSSYRQIDCML